jgi:hypothetical protein
VAQVTTHRLGQLLILEENSRSYSLVECSLNLACCSITNLLRNLFVFVAKLLNSNASERRYIIHNYQECS